jgi:hypothetical protein
MNESFDVNSIQTCFSYIVRESMKSNLHTKFVPPFSFYNKKCWLITIKCRAESKTKSNIYNDEINVGIQ